MKSETYILPALLAVESRLTHMAGTEGNEAVLMREPVVTPSGVRMVPTITGNALRHRVVRAPLARHLVESWDLYGALDEMQLNFLFHGGSLTEKGGRESLSQQQDVYRLLSLAKLLGLSLPSTPIPGQLQVSMGVLVCAENQDRLRSFVPEKWLSGLNLRPAREFVQGWQYTRSNSTISTPDLLSSEQGLSDSSQMIYGGESVAAGARFVSEFRANRVDKITIGALLYALDRWQNEGGAIGGQASRGHGRIRLLVGFPEGWEYAVEQYKEHLLASREEGRALLERLFPRKGKKRASKSA